MPEGDPLRARSGVAYWAFSYYLRWYFKRNFHALRIARGGLPVAPADRPLIVCSNHPGWWDPATFVLLCSMLMPSRIGFGPMDAASLKNYGVLGKVGVFGIDPHTRQGAELFLRTGLRILSHPKRSLWITAEGTFTDPRARPIRLRSGIAHLARRVPQAMILPLALEYPFWNERRPEALAYFGTPIDVGATDRTVSAWTTALEEALTGTMDHLATLSMTRNPALFHTVLRGQAGIGGIYDVWRHAGALVRGQRFDPSHEGRR